jgi:hypothetical protein
MRILAGAQLALKLLYASDEKMRRYGSSQVQGWILQTRGKSSGYILFAGLSLRIHEFREKKMLLTDVSGSACLHTFFDFAKMATRVLSLEWIHVAPCIASAAYVYSGSTKHLSEQPCGITTQMPRACMQNTTLRRRPLRRTRKGYDEPTGAAEHQPRILNTGQTSTYKRRRSPLSLDLSIFCLQSNHPLLHDL